MKMHLNVKRILAGIGLSVGFCLIVFFMWYSNYRKSRANEIVLKSRYTFSIRIDEEGNVLGDEDESFEENSPVTSGFSNLSLAKISDIWLTEFTNQYTTKYVPWSKALKKIKTNEPVVLDEQSNTVMVSFSAALKNSKSEYFSSWNGVIDNDRLQCEWVIVFNISDHYDGTATISVASLLTPEDYGISMYNESLANSTTNGTESATSSGTNDLTKYEIKNGTVSVTYDGGEKYVIVPVDCDYLRFKDDSTTVLATGSFMIDTKKTAFLYGGNSVNGKKTPVTLVYSNDKGNNWISCEIDKIYDASYFYVNFFDEKNGIIVVGYGKNTNQEASKIYTTSNGGEDWSMIGSGPANNLIKGVLYIDQNVGFFCYDYVSGMDSNLYYTKDGNISFSKVNFEPHELDSTATNNSTSTNTQSGASTLQWSDVYKEALVPIYDEDGILTVYLSQGTDGTYNNGKTAAKYQSTDNGNTWKYIAQVELAF
jgi:hypothetical protein